MNSLIFYPKEELGEGKVRIVGGRLHYLREFHELKLGSEIPIGKFGAGRGRGKIVRISDTECEIEYELFAPPYERTPITALVAVPRPQAIKRTLQAATLLGISNLGFFVSENVEKSYLSSRELEPERVSLEILKALEQAGDTIGPEVSIYNNIWNALGSLSADTERIAFDTQSNLLTLVEVYNKIRFPCSVCIGPEKGWSSSERELMKEQGFTLMSLGPRILRVDVAVTASVAQLLALGGLSR